MPDYRWDVVQSLYDALSTMTPKDQRICSHIMRRNTNLYTPASDDAIESAVESFGITRERAENTFNRWIKKASHIRDSFYEDKKKEQEDE